MRFALYTVNDDQNGGTVVLRHIKCALETLGHTVIMLHYGEDLVDQVDYIWFQSQFYGAVKDVLRNSSAKKICWLEHFDPPAEFAYEPIERIEADYFNTQYKGPVVEWAKERIGKDIAYFPLAACEKCMHPEPNISNVPPVVCITRLSPYKNGNTLAAIAATHITCSYDALNGVYGSAVVVANVHAEFQKGITKDYLGHYGDSVNDRIFHVPMAGGLVVNDNNPMIREFFNENEMVVCNDEPDMTKRIAWLIAHPVERMSYIALAWERIMKEHLYIHRLNNYLPIIS